MIWARNHVTSLSDAVLSGRVLSADDDARFRDHLRACAPCREHYDRTASVLRLARGNAEALAPGEAQRLEVRAGRLARPIAGSATFPWRIAFASAAVAAALVLTVLAWPRSAVGRVLAAGPGLRLDGVLVGKDAVVFAGAQISTEKEDAAILLESARGRRGLLLRPGTRLTTPSSDEVRLEAGRVRVQVKQPSDPFAVRADELRVVQPGAGTFVVEQRSASTLVAVHQGAVVVVSARGQQVELSEGQETELSGGSLAPARPASANALVEDRGDGTVWDAILRFLRQLIDVIAKALAGD
ncbi:MAG: FecR domain-containing protein [Archangium sp.]|nr:FecR domain-containing protein [Archangium sp.]